MIDKSVLTKIKSDIPKDIIFTSPEDLTSASYDASKKTAQPDIVIKPKTPGQISAILKIANQNNIPVYPRGAATSVTGSAVPVKGGIVIDTSRMNKIIEINKNNLTAIVEPGVVVGDFQREAEKNGLFYPPDPASSETSTIGGNVATCAGGLRCVKYGVTRDYIIGLEVALADGSIIHTGSYTLKCVTGYDLTRLFVGSEGTLGIFTKIYLKLIPKPEHKETLIAFYPDIKSAIYTAKDTLTSGILPTALEFMDEPSTKAVQKYHKEFTMPQSAKAILLLELDGTASDTSKSAKETQKILKSNNNLKTILAKDRKESDNLWAIRKAISPALYSITDKKISEDISLPLDKVNPMMDAISKLESKHGIPVAVFGHLGDGNLHVNFLVSVEAQEASLEKAVEELFKETIDLGGTLSGEHGIGLAKSKYISLAIPNQELEIMGQIKKLFDPKGILNPGKTF